MRFLLAVLALFVLTALPSLAPAQPTGCDGPPDLCQQISDLNAKLAAAKASKAATEKKVDTTVAVAVAEDDKKKTDKTAKLIAVAGMIAVGLKILLSSLDQWKGYFTTIRGKAVLKLITVAVGFLAFLATNVGFGIPWWQSLILAGGGPGALLVHDMMEIIPALNGKKQEKEDAKIDAKVAVKVAEVVASIPPPPSANG